MLLVCRSAIKSSMWHAGPDTSPRQRASEAPTQPVSTFLQLRFDWRSKPIRALGLSTAMPRRSHLPMESSMQSSMLSACLTPSIRTRSPRRCIAFSMVYHAIRAHGSLDVGLPSGPDFFGCGRPDYAEQMLNGAGFCDVAMKEVPLI